MDIYEIIGYVGSVLVAVSLMMKNILYLRRVNLLGAATFAIYGLLVGAYPVFVLNSFISIVDIYYLYEMNKRKDFFNLMPVLDKNHRYLNKFIKHYYSDILKFFPEFKKDELDDVSCFFILRNLMPVGLFIYKEESENRINVIVDYAIPDYRDMKNAKYVYDVESNFLKEKGYREIVQESTIKKHIKYLLKIGFEKLDDNSNLFRKAI